MINQYNVYFFCPQDGPHLLITLIKEYFCLSLPNPWAGGGKNQKKIIFSHCDMLDVWVLGGGVGAVVKRTWSFLSGQSGLRVGESHSPYGCPGSSAAWSQMRTFSGWSLKQTAGAGVAGVLRKNMRSGQHHRPLGAKRLTNCGAWGHIWHWSGLFIYRNIWRCFESDEDFRVRSI